MYLSINKTWWDKHKKEMTKEFFAAMQDDGFLYPEDEPIGWEFDEQNMTLTFTEATEGGEGIHVSIQLDMTPEFLAKMLEVILKRGNKLK